MHTREARKLARKENDVKRISFIYFSKVLITGFVICAGLALLGVVAGNEALMKVGTVMAFFFLCAEVLVLAVWGLYAL